uniref:Protein phosphatase n=1 Tax=Nelumbo nucifera TaxID=4432 RepID=A0A822YC73_NELNU|nr:TPA_asm: hypothetical protein HUJ06_030367 [Nelumbo nucifera]
MYQFTRSVLISPLLLQTSFFLPLLGVLHKSKRNMILKAGSFYIPKKNALKPQGEDAHFICPQQQAFGVADGVGGWVKQGVDSGEYARELMKNSTIALQAEPEDAVDLERVLRVACSNTNAIGSSTACIMQLFNECLHAVNVGDSGFLVIRDGKIFYSSPIQQHKFNCPYQLGNNPKCDQPNSAMVSDYTCFPASFCAIFENFHIDYFLSWICQVLKVPIKLGDVIVAGTDGLFDNFGSTVGSMDAHHSSLQRDCLSPFSEASKMAGFNYLGGKKDDITVVVAYVVPSE